MPIQYMINYTKLFSPKMNYYRHFSLCIGKEDEFVCAHDEIFKLFIKGDRQAMSILVEAYKNELFNLCFRLTFNQHDAEDLFQQTWVKATKNAAKYEHQSFKPWLLKICINQYRDNYRQYVKRKNHVKDDFESTSVKEYVLMAAGSTDSVEEQYERNVITSYSIHYTKLYEF